VVAPPFYIIFPIRHNPYKPQRPVFKSSLPFAYYDAEIGSFGQFAVGGTPGLPSSNGVMFLYTSDKAFINELRIDSVGFWIALIILHDSSPLFSTHIEMIFQIDFRFFYRVH